MDVNMPEIKLESEFEKLKKLKKDFEWFESNYKKLKQEYKGEYVAIKNGSISYHDIDVFKLMEKMKETGENTSSFIIQHISEDKYIYAV
jgi:hypothetical protein